MRRDSINILVVYQGVYHIHTAVVRSSEGCDDLSRRFMSLSLNLGVLGPERVLHREQTVIFRLWLKVDRYLVLNPYLFITVSVFLW